MANLAIKGHSTRGSEVIALLEMLGGKIRRDRLAGNELFSWYYINGNGYIDYKHYSLFDDTTVFTLEEFEEKFPYKIGDKVSSKYLKNYKIGKMEWKDTNNRVIYKLQGMGWYSVDELQPYKEETIGKEIVYDEINFNRCPCADKVQLILGDDFEIKVEDGKTFVVRKETQYPKTYVECAKILDCFSAAHIDGYKCELLEKLQELIVCRDAYWKIAGEQMGLGKPLGPDWLNPDVDLYVIINIYNRVEKVKYGYGFQQCLLTFPTEEMRDAFYENFKKLIETCKEFL